MNKTLISSMLIASAITFVSAEETQRTAPVRSVPVKAEFAKSTKGMMASSTAMRKEMGDKHPRMVASGTPMMKGEVRGEGMPTTGDPVLDEQIHALKKEMDEKIQAIRTEYEGKLKVLIGEKKLTRSSSTPVHRDTYEKMRNGSGTPVGGERGDRQGEQGDRPHPPMGTSTPRRIENRKPQVDGPTGIIRNFFQSMFGGAPSEAQAQEGR